MEFLRDQVNHDIQSIKKWFLRLNSLQQEHLAKQVLFTLPFIRFDLEDCKPLNFIKLFSRNHIPGDNLFDNRRSIFFLLCLCQSIDIILYRYPSNEDEYLDWYNEWKGLRLYENFGVSLIKYGYKGDLQDNSAMMAFHASTMLEAKNSWEKAKDEMKSVAQQV